MSTRLSLGKSTLEIRAIVPPYPLLITLSPAGAGWASTARIVFTRPSRARQDALFTQASAVSSRAFCEHGGRPPPAALLSLALLVARILAEDSHHALAPDHLTFGADRLDG